MYRDQWGKKEQWQPQPGAELWDTKSGALQRRELTYMPRKATPLAAWKATYQVIKQRMDTSQKESWQRFFAERDAIEAKVCQECVRLRKVQFDNRKLIADKTDKDLVARKAALRYQAGKKLRAHLQEDRLAHPPPSLDDIWPFFRDEVDGEDLLAAVTDDEEEEEEDQSLAPGCVMHDQFEPEAFVVGRNQDPPLEDLKIGMFVVMQPVSMDWEDNQDYYIGKLCAFDEEAEKQATVQWYSNKEQATLTTSTFKAGWVGPERKRKGKSKGRASAKSKAIQIQAKNAQASSSSSSSSTGAHEYYWEVRKPRYTGVEMWTDQVYKDSLIYWSKADDFLTTEFRVDHKHRVRIMRRLARLGLVRESTKKKRKK